MNENNIKPEGIDDVIIQFLQKIKNLDEDTRKRYFEILNQKIERDKKDLSKII